MCIVVANVNDSETFKYAKRLYNKLKSKGIDVLFDDRKESIGVKFADMDLIGIPIRITVGQSFVTGELEFKLRNSMFTEYVKCSDIIKKVEDVIEKSY